MRVVEIFERAGGRPFEAQFVPEEALKGQQEAATDPMQQSFAALLRCYAMGDPIDMSVLPGIYGVQLISVEDHVRQVVAPAQ